MGPRGGRVGEVRLPDGDEGVEEDGAAFADLRATGEEQLDGSITTT